jgi:hypothetical protein
MFLFERVETSFKHLFICMGTDARYPLDSDGSRIFMNRGDFGQKTCFELFLFGVVSAHFRTFSAGKNQKEF